MAEFLVVYDYGMGGVWGFATAESIENLSPELNIIDKEPDWMTAETEARTRAISSFVVGEDATYPDWLRVLIRRR